MDNPNTNRCAHVSVTTGTLTEPLWHLSPCRPFGWLGNSPSSGTKEQGVWAAGFIPPTPHAPPPWGIFFAPASHSIVPIAWEIIPSCPLLGKLFLP